MAVMANWQKNNQVIAAKLRGLQATGLWKRSFLSPTGPTVVTGSRSAGSEPS